MTLGRHYLAGLSKQASFWTGLRAVNRFMGKGVIERLAPRLAKYKGAGGFRGAAYNTVNTLSKPTWALGIGMGGTMGLDAMSRSENPTMRAIGNNPVLNLGVGATMPVWTALDKIPNAIGNARLGSAEMQEKIKADAKRGTSSAVNDFIALSTQGQRMFKPNAYLDAVDQGYGDPTATSRARDAYQNPTAPRELSNFEKLWKPSDELIQNGIQRRAYEFDKGASSKTKIGVTGAQKAWGWLKGMVQSKPKVPTAAPVPVPSAPVPAPSVPMTGWDKAKTGAGATLGLGFAGAGVYGGAKKIFGTPYDPAQVESEARAAAQAAIQKRMNNLGPMERFALKMDPTLAVGFMEKEMPGSVAQWEKATGQRYNPGFLSALHQKATGPTTGKFYEFDAQGNKRFYPGQGI